MRILIAEDAPGAATAVTTQLRARGHTVRNCAPPPGSSAPCIGLSQEGVCPLDDEPVTVALDVRHRGFDRLTTNEFPAVCAMRRDIPVIVAGAPRNRRAITWAVRGCSEQDAVEACEEVAQLAETVVTGSLQGTVHRLLGRHGIHVDAGVRLVPGVPAPQVVVDVPAVLSPDARRQLETAVRLVLRKHGWGSEATVRFGRLAGPAPKDPPPAGPRPPTK